MVLSLLPTFALAGDVTVTEGVKENPVCAIGNVGYASLAEAIVACPGDATTPAAEPTTIVMLANHKILGDDNDNKGWTIAKGKDIVLDLNGFKVYQYVTASKAAAVIEVYGKLTVEDNSTSKTGLICNSIF